MRWIYRMTTEDIHKIYELEAMIDQALGLLLQVHKSVQAMKPETRQRYSSKVAMINEFHQLTHRKRKGKR